MTYFLLFYTVLLGTFFSLIYSVMYFDIDKEELTLIGFSSALDFKSELIIIPRSDIHSGLILMTTLSTLIVGGFTSGLMAYIYPYQRAGDRVELMQCAKDDGTYVFDGIRPCAFDVDSAWHCNLNSVFRYDGESPCINFMITFQLLLFGD